MHTDPFVTLAFFGLALIIVCVVGGVAEHARRRRNWRRWDADRRSSRRANLNLRRTTGWS